MCIKNEITDKKSAINENKNKNNKSLNVSINCW